MEVAPDFDEFIACLTADGVEFVIVGAYALAFHGAPRFTGDLDVLIQPTVDNSARLLTGHSETKREAVRGCRRRGRVLPVDGQRPKWNDS